MSFFGTGTKDSMIGSAVCRRTRACWRLTQTGWPPAAGFLLEELDSGWGGGGFCHRGASCMSSCPSTPALVAMFSPRRAPYSACTLPLEWRGQSGPCGWIAARDETTSASSAHASAERRHPLVGLLHIWSHNKRRRKTCLSLLLLLWLWLLCYCVLLCVIVCYCVL